MTTWQPITRTPIQYADANGVPYSGAVIKAYVAGTTTVTNLSTSSTGATTVTSVALNASGYPAVSGNITLLYVSVDYKLALYPSQASADANTGAIWTIDNIARDFAGVASLPSGTMTASDEVIGYQGGVVKRLTVPISGLSDVEEDVTWTPTLYGATTSGTTTYSNQKGTYNKIGNVVVLNGTIGWDNATGTGEARVGGLPYTAKNFSGNFRFGLSVAWFNSLALPSGTNLSGYLQDGENFIRLANVNNNTANDPTDLQSELTTLGSLFFSITYTV